MCICIDEWAVSHTVRAIVFLFFSFVQAFTELQLFFQKIQMKV